MTVPASPQRNRRARALDRADRLVVAGSLLLLMGLVAWQVGPQSQSGWALVVTMVLNGVAFLGLGGAMSMSPGGSPVSRASVR